MTSSPFWRWSRNSLVVKILGGLVEVGSIPKLIADRLHEADIGPSADSLRRPRFRKLDPDVGLPPPRPFSVGLRIGFDAKRASDRKMRGSPKSGQCATSFQENASAFPVIPHGQRHGKLFCYNVTHGDDLESVRVDASSPLIALCWGVGPRLALATVVSLGLWLAVGWALDWWV